MKTPKGRGGLILPSLVTSHNIGKRKKKKILKGNRDGEQRTRRAEFQARIVHRQGKPLETSNGKEFYK